MRPSVILGFSEWLTGRGSSSKNARVAADSVHKSGGDVETGSSRNDYDLGDPSTLNIGKLPICFEIMPYFRANQRLLSPRFGQATDRN